MLVIDYIKLLGVFLSLYLVICYKRQHLDSWITIGRYTINHADLMLGYFTSTLICSLIYWPMVSTYAVWFYYGTIIATVSTYKMLFLDLPPNRYAILLNLLIAAEFIVILADDLYWEWQSKIIVIGFVASLTAPIIIAVGRYHLEQLKVEITKK